MFCCCSSTIHTYILLVFIVDTSDCPFFVSLIFLVCCYYSQCAVDNRESIFKHFFHPLSPIIIIINIISDSIVHYILFHSIFSRTFYLFRTFFLHILVAVVAWIVLYFIDSCVFFFFVYFSLYTFLPISIKCSYLCVFCFCFSFLFSFQNIFCFFF